MPIYFYQGKILFVNGLIAMHSSCCCGDTATCCCGLDPNTTYTATLSSSCAAVDGRTIPLKITIGLGGNICETLAQTEAETIDNCTLSTIPIIIVLRCNKLLPIRNGQSQCDQYELMMFYSASPCRDERNYVRVSEGCSCSPLSLSFVMKAPSWSGQGVQDCNCCNREDVTVTITA